MDPALSIALGVGLAAAVGLRVFLPMLVLSVATFTGHLTLDECDQLLIGFATRECPCAVVE
jgi:hypothetical protein